MTTAFVFPGQGSQFVGMGKGLAEDYLDRANQILGFDLKKFVLEGPEEELKKTAIQQPAIFTVSVAAFAQLQIPMLASLDRDPDSHIGTSNFKPQMVAGHSLGEYSALYAAGAISFEDGVKIVHLRGKFMQAAVPEGVGAMAALLGGDRETIIKICAEIGDVWPANFNSPDQVVISGKKESVVAAGEKLKAAGVKKVIPLPVSAPFHCPLMQAAADKLAKVLDNIQIKDAIIPVIANVTALSVTSGNEIRKLLVKQVTSPVLWEDSIRKMVADGVTQFVEVGPGKVLAGLIKKIDSSVEVKSYEEIGK